MSLYVGDIYQMSYNTIDSPDDEQVVAQNM